MRKIYATTTAIVSSMLAMAVSAKADTITVLAYASQTPPDLAEQFEKKTGHKMELVTAASTEEILGRIMASNGAGYDVVLISSNGAEPLIKMGMAAKLDHTKLPNIENLASEASQLPYDKGNVFTLPYDWGTHGICYRADLVKKIPDSWWDLLKPSDDMLRKYTMVSSERNLLEPAQAVLGYSYNDTDPARLQEVKKLLIDVKSKILAYDNATMGSRLVSGEIAMAQSWDGWCNQATTENSSVKFVIPKEGADLFVDVFMMLEASENKEAAQSILNFVLEPESHSWVATSLLFNVPNTAAMRMVPKEFLEKYSNLSLSPAELLKYEVFLELGEKQPEITKLATEILSSQ